MKKVFSQPDLNAPRYKVSRLANLNVKFHQRFIKKFTKHKDVSNEQLKNIITAFNTNVWDCVVNERDGAELPEGLGYLFVGTCPALVKRPNLDYALSKKHEQPINSRNFESDNFIAKIFYSNFATRCKFKMRQVWMFKGCREFTRGVSKEYPENWKRYVQVDSFMHIRKLYEKHHNKELAIRFAVKPTAEYNEFDLD